MFDFTVTQTVIAVIILLFFGLFYIRRAWFWFWKVTRLLKQFEALEEITVSTNREVKDVNRKLGKLISSLDQGK